jgi:hypothetical protein
VINISMSFLSLHWPQHLKQLIYPTYHQMFSVVLLHSYLAMKY